jgi:hypothetical protein
MAILGIQDINVGLPNESTGSDSLYTAFNKTITNFTTLFACASPYNTFTGGVGITASANSNTNTVTITNTGVTYLNQGTGIILSGNTGNITISSYGGGNGSGGTVTSVGIAPVSSSRILVTNSPIVSNGTITLDLANSGVTAGSYTYPSLTVDQYGRVTSIANAASVGTVTSIGMITSGIGIQLSGSPITTTGNITIVNTGVTRLSAGTGINLSGSNGNVTISTTTTGGTVTSVGLSSSTLTVTNSPITSVGTMTVELPANLTVTGQLLLSSSENLANGAAVNLSTTASYFSTAAPSTATLAAGSTGQIKTFMMVADGGDMIITVTNAGWKSSGTGTITFNDIGDGCTLQYINSKWFCIGQNGVVFG